jgi:hypothetical protein
MVFVDVAMRTRQPIEYRLLLLLLRSLARSTDSNIAQASCRTAIRLFNNWSLLVPSKDSKDGGKSELQAIQNYVTSLETSHAALRTSIMVSWNQGAVPGPHLQTMLELVLAGTRAMAEQSPQTGPAVTASKDVPAYQLEYYNKFRDGRTTISWINCLARKLTTNMDLSASDNGQYGANELMVGDVCVRGGGKWYWEVKLNSQPDSVFIGWLTRDFRTQQGYAGFGQDGQGHSWVLCGPRTQYYHRAQSRYPQPVIGPDGKSKPVPSNWTVGMVIGVMLDVTARRVSAQLYFVLLLLPPSRASG